MSAHRNRTTSLSQEQLPNEHVRVAVPATRVRAQEFETRDTPATGVLSRIRRTDVTTTSDNVVIALTESGAAIFSARITNAALPDTILRTSKRIPEIILGDLTGLTIAIDGAYFRVGSIHAEDARMVLVDLNAPFRSVDIRRLRETGNPDQPWTPFAESAPMQLHSVETFDEPDPEDVAPTAEEIQAAHNAEQEAAREELEAARAEELAQAQQRAALAEQRATQAEQVAAHATEREQSEAARATALEEQDAARAAGREQVDAARAEQDAAREELEAARAEELAQAQQRAALAEQRATQAEQVAAHATEREQSEAARATALEEQDAARAAEREQVTVFAPVTVFEADVTEEDLEEAEEVEVEEEAVLETEEAEAEVEELEVVAEAEETEVVEAILEDEEDEAATDVVEAQADETFDEAEVVEESETVDEAETVLEDEEDLDLSKPEPEARGPVEPATQDASPQDHVRPRDDAASNGPPVPLNRTTSWARKLVPGQEILYAVPARSEEAIFATVQEDDAEEAKKSKRGRRLLSGLFAVTTDTHPDDVVIAFGPETCFLFEPSSRNRARPVRQLDQLPDGPVESTLEPIDEDKSQLAIGDRNFVVDRLYIRNLGAFLALDNHREQVSKKRGAWTEVVVEFEKQLRIPDEFRTPVETRSRPTIQCQRLLKDDDTYVALAVPGKAVVREDTDDEKGDFIIAFTDGAPLLFTAQKSNKALPWEPRGVIEDAMPLSFGPHERAGGVLSLNGREFLVPHAYVKSLEQHLAERVESASSS